MAERAKRRLKIEVEEVREDEYHIALLGDVREEVCDARDLGARAARLGEEQLSDDVQQVMAPLARREKLAYPVGEEDETDAIVVVQGRHRQERGDVRRELELVHVRGAKPAARRDVDREVDIELAFLAVFLDVGHVHPCSDVPVDAADVVAGLVLAHFLEIEA